MFRTRIPLGRKFWMMGTLLVLALSLPACSRAGEEARSGGGGAVEDRPVGVSKPGDGAVGEAVPDSLVGQGDFGRKIVKTADLGITSEDVRGEATRAQQAAARVGGTIVEARTYRADNALYADLVISVPSDRFGEALDELRALGEEVTTDTVSGQDVTEEYVDLRSRERNLLAAERSLLDLYERAEDVQDALSIQRELTGVRGQIEQIQGRMKYLEQSSDSSRISLGIRPVASSPKPPPPWDPARTVARAWNASLAVLQALAAALISAIVFGWWMVPVLALGAWRVGRRRQATVPSPSHDEP